MDTETPDLQQRLLALEERKVALDEREQATKEHSRRGEFLKTNLAAMLAFLTSIASLFIAYHSVQVNESAERERRQVEQQRLALETKKLEADATQSDRKWHIDLLDFTAKNRDLIFGADEAAKQRVSKIMLVAFPAELVLPLFQRLEQVSPATAAWKEGAQEARVLTQAQPARLTAVAGCSKFGVFRGGKWEERIFTNKTRAEGALPQPGDTVIATTDVFIRADFPVFKQGVGLIYKKEVGVLSEATTATVAEVQVFRGTDYWIRLNPTQ